LKNSPGVRKASSLNQSTPYMSGRRRGEAKLRHASVEDMVS
jgi:hypothetical protein